VAQYLDIAHRMLPELRDPFRLADIHVPVLLVWGDRDRLVFARGASRVLEAVPDARLEVLEGVGHCPQVEAPQRFTELLLEFDDQLAAAA
jgi:pimeloyl-ACP methyl ester carboxylesterase